jgi:sugar/nucleoside kinase (ribokinase family)
LAVHATIVAVICTLGDLLLDVVVRGPAPLAVGADTTVETRLASGGQAANVAAWSVELGEEARFVGKLADDAAGELGRSLLERRGVEVVGPVVEGRNGVVVALVGPDGERTMATDRGVAPELRADELDASWFSGCRWLHLSGYSLLAEPIVEAALAAARLARAEGAGVSVDLSSWSAIRTYGPARFRKRLEELGPDLLFANEPEWELVGGAYALAETAVLKRGSRGVIVHGPGGNEEHAAAGVDVVDTTGAGDALAAGFIVSGIELGLEAAARCVGQLGAAPS